MAIAYLELQDCINRCFPYIRNHLQYAEHAPDYEQSKDGMSILNTILTFVKRDDYYINFAQKSAYLFCSMSHRHAFSNGNKRLAATLLRYFLQDNNIKTVEFSERQWRNVTKELFPEYQWKIVEIDDAFYSLLYNLAFIAADGQLRPGVNFDDCKAIFTALFERIFEVPNTFENN